MPAEKRIDEQTHMSEAIEEKRKVDKVAKDSRLQWSGIDSNIADDVEDSGLQDPSGIRTTRSKGRIGSAHENKKRGDPCLDSACRTSS
jgi:hypothetical protein